MPGLIPPRGIVAVGMLNVGEAVGLTAALGLRGAEGGMGLTGALSGTVVAVRPVGGTGGTEIPPIVGGFGGSGMVKAPC